MTSATAELLTLSLDLVQPDIRQPRKAFDKGELDELSASIKAEGLLQPILVRPNGKGYLIVDGERRYRAVRQAGLASIQALVRDDLKDADVSALQLVANIQRADLSLPEQCEAVAKLVNAQGFKQSAQLLGKSESWVSKRVNALKAPDKLVKKLRDGTIKDLELVGGLAELSEIDPEQFEASLSNLDSHDPWERVDRESVREAVEDAKQRKKYEAEAREREEAEAAKAQKNGKAVRPAEKISPQEAAMRARERKMAQTKEDRRALREAADAALYKALQIKRRGYMDPLELRYSDDFPGAGSADFAKFPTSAETAKFKAVSYGDIAHLKRIAAGLPGSPVVDLESMQLSLEDAQRVSDALKGRPGAKQLDMHFVHEITGAQVRQMVSKLAPEAVSTLPLPRGERERQKNGQAAGKAATSKLPKGRTKASKTAGKKKVRK